MRNQYLHIYCAVTAQLISTFAFDTWIEQFIYFLNPKFQASGHVLCLNSSISVGPVRKPHCYFSPDAAQSCLGFKLIFQRTICSMKILLSHNIFFTAFVCIRYCIGLVAKSYEHKFLCNKICLGIKLIFHRLLHG